MPRSATIFTILLLFFGLSACKKSNSSDVQPVQKDAQQQPDAMSDDSNNNDEETTSRDSDGGSDEHLDELGHDSLRPPQPDEPAWNPRKPPVVTAIHVLESFPVQYSSEFSMTSPTGGWSMTLDRVELADGGVLTAWLTITRPPDDEVVTTALVTHKLTHQAGTDEIATVLTMVRRVVKGDDPDQVEYERE